MPEGSDKRLERLTEEYWEKLRHNYRRRVPVWREYARDLLPLEMTGKSAPEYCHTLVLLVGHSIEPLLQSVWVYEPRELLLILNKQYGAKMSGENFAKILRRDLLSQLPKDRQLSEEHIHQETVQPTPADVFRVLVEQARGQENVVVDITGAKKSMVAGAFLYAAYANVPVSYVDFDDAAFNTRYGKPYGYASRIHSFANPYTTFALRDWERVQQLYSSYHFREARKLLEEDIVPMMEEPYFGSEHILATKRLIAVLHCYEFWDGGDLSAAQQKARLIQEQGVDFHPPSVVETLGDIWPCASDRSSAQEAAGELLSDHKSLTLGANDPGNSIFCRADWLAVYAEDELARIERLVEYNEDYRSALLRAASLNEVLLKGRVARIWYDDKLVVPPGKSLPTFEMLMERATARPMLWLLMGDKPLRGAELAPETSRLRSFWVECSLDLETVIGLRNKTIHTYLSVPRSVAEGTAEVARRNLDDYLEHWAVEPIPDLIAVRALKWRELSELCGADVFLPLQSSGLRR